MPLKSLCFVLLCCTACVHSAKILGVFHNPSKSHFMLGNTLMKALANRGHQVTLLSPYPVNTTLKNYEIIEVDGLQMFKDSVVERVTTVINATTYEKMRSLQDNYAKLTDLFLRHPKVKKLLASQRTYDLVIIDWVFNEAFLGIADHFKAHSVVFSAQGSSSAVNKLTANPASSAYVTSIIPALPDEMTFLQRAANTMGRLLFEFIEFYQKLLQDRLLREHFPSAPYVGDLYANISLVLLNSHFTVETPRPYVPSMISIGGFHIPELKPLENELKTFLDQATEGVVYCSFGSIIKSSNLSADKVEILAKTFSNLPLKVLWKFESDNMPQLSSNVRTAKWFPQNDILAHPNVKLFISHGGLLSVFETMYHGIPILAAPFFGDHEANVEIAVNRGYAKKLSFHNMNEETLAEAIKEVLNNPKYYENVKERSKWYRDRPMKPLDTAIYWIEYVLRYNGAHHLKTAALKLSWYQYYLLDVAALIMAILSIFYIVLKILVRLIKAMFSNRSEDFPKKFL